MVWAQPPGVDGIKCPSIIPLELVLLDIGIQVCIFTDLIKDVIDSSIVYFKLLYTLSDSLHTLLLYILFLSAGKCNILEIISLSGVEFEG